MSAAVDETPHARLALVLHFHQPVGNLDEVVHRCCDRCYAPFLAALEAHPDVVATLHFSGALLEWLEQHRPEIIAVLGRLAGRRQIELQTGGFYEPILAVLPPDDVREQIRMQTGYLRQRFGVEATGLWLTERVWEPHLPELLADAGVRYVVLDDTIFRSAGVPQEELVGAFETEHLGRAVRVYPAAKALRYTIPFQPPEETIRLLREAGERRQGALLVYADDGEKFGEWPHTAETVYGGRWLERFFQALREARGWLRMVKLGEDEAVAPARPRRRVYLPTASYDEMMIWTLPPEVQPRMAALVQELDRRPDASQVRPFVRGGTWRAFFARYPESDHLHKRILEAGRRIAALPDGPARSEARRDLLRAECNCAFWHGVFGGLYLVHLRNALWRHLIRAEVVTDRELRGKPDASAASSRSEELPGRAVLRSPEAVAVLEEGEGSLVTELDQRSTGLNVLSVVARRPEAYHAELARRGTEGGGGSSGGGEPTGPEGGGARSIHDDVVLKEGVRDVVLAYDTHRRGAFVDWIVAAGTPRAAYGSAAWSDFHHGLLGREAKTVVLEGRTLIACYREGRSPKSGRDGTRLGVECSFQLGEPGSPERTITVEASAGRDETRVGYAAAGGIEGATSVVVRERPGGPGIRVKLSAPSEVWWFPVETVSASEAGLERTPQGTSFLFFSSAPGFTISLELLEPAA